MTKRFHLPICLLLLPCAFTTARAADKADAFPFKDGDRVAWVGSSSTHIGVWPRTMEFLLRTRNPDVHLTFQKFSTEGPKYAPEQYALVTEQMAAMKAGLEKQDYQSVLNMVHKIAPNMKTLANAIASKKDEVRVALDGQWTSMSRDLPKSLAAVEAKAAELKKSGRLPKGVSKDALAGAAADINGAKQGWSDAQSAKASGKLEDAVAKGTAAAATVSKLMASLGMSSGTPAAK